MFYNRDLEKILKKYTKFPIIAVLGPRQSGKTTLVKHTFKDHVFLNVDDPEIRAMIQSDPKGFLRKHENNSGIILDEFQNVPELLPYLKVMVDEQKKPGYFILTGSHNFLMHQAITESLAGRVAILTLLPFSLSELKNNNLINKSPEDAIFRGNYPQLFTNDFQASEVYPSYIRTYIERDVRQLINVSNLHTFQKFIKLCAARIGQLLNFSDLAVNCGISVPTVHQWLSILQSSYIIFLLPPYFENFNKRVVKTPKLYFYDTGVACNILEIESPKILALSSLYGHLFESFIISDLYKQYYNQGSTKQLYFWRDKNGEIEIDCLLQKDNELIAIEIKSGETYSNHFFDSLKKWNKITNTSEINNYIIYGGTMNADLEQGHIISWYDAESIMKKI